MIIDGKDYFAHIGTPRHSGRYPWGSGENPSVSNRTFLDEVADLQRKGVSQADIATAMGLNSTTELRKLKTIARTEAKQADIAMAQRLKDKGYGDSAIARRMSVDGRRVGESTVRSWLKPGEKDKLDVLQATADMLKAAVDKKGFIDIGAGVEYLVPTSVSKEKLATAVMLLQKQGYAVHTVQVDQIIGKNQKTNVKVLAPPGTTYVDIVKNKDKIHQITDFSEDGGRSYMGIQPPLSISSKRVAVRYAEQGGKEADGVIYVRPGVPDVTLGGTRYSQVRIAVDGTHYLKGMAMYKDDLPAGVDLMFNTNKSDTGVKTDAMKPMRKHLDGTVDQDNPFGSAIDRQIIKKHPDGRQEVTSAMNIVNDAGKWQEWSRTLSSQFLSKQGRTLVKTQLDMTYERKRAELDQILTLTNPEVKKKLLTSFTDDADASAVHLKAAQLPKQITHVILPLSKIKENEIYAPNYDNGTRVVLIRHPHGGTFEIPELTVNNRNPEGKKLIGTGVDAPDAVGIHSKVAERLSGADFDGDTVLVIPNNQGKVKTTAALEGLKGFDPQRAYPYYEGMAKMTVQAKGTQMGLVSNLITDMTILGADRPELARAIRHSMVVIDAEKHGLNYKQSAIDNGISQLMQKYQGKAQGGSKTLVSRAKSRIDVRERKPRSTKDGGPIDKATGKKVFTPTGKHWVNAKGKTVFATERSKKLVETDNAHTLSSGTVNEKLYADHSNRLKALANEGRKALVNVKSIRYSDSARVVYKKEVASLNAKLALALRNAPLERQAQILANAKYNLMKQANADMEESEIKKLKFIALEQARIATGAKKERIDITASEWDAIQAGAITKHNLNEILRNTDLDKVKKLATPKSVDTMTNVKLVRARAMLDDNYTQAEVAAHLGVSLSTLMKSLSGE